MGFAGRRTAICLIALVLAAASSARAGDASWVVAAYERSDAPTAYTFHMTLGLAMHHFPWLHFHVEGDGEYDKGKKYEVNFTKVPFFFGDKLQKVDLAVIDPSMWPQRYNVSIAGKDGDNTVFSLHDVDPQSKLIEALVTLTPDAIARNLDLKFNDGTHITMNLNSNDTSGYVLPCNGTAEINAPHMAMSAQADFTNYNVTVP